MKKLLLSLLISIGTQASAQTLTQANHFPISSTQFTTVQCDSASITGSSIAGNGVTWDYSSIILRTVDFEKINYVSAVQSNTNYPQATISVGTATNNVSYYSTDGNKQYYWGGNIFLKLPGTALNTDLNLNFTTPSVYMAYPASFSTTTSDSTAGSSTIGNFTGNTNTYVDGVGSLQLAAKTFTDAIRVKTVETFTIPVVVFGVTLYTNLNKTKYDYYSLSASRHPILSIDSTFLTSLAGSDIQKYVILQKDYDIVSINENKIDNIQLSVFPNPAINSINFTTTSAEATNVVAYDISGKAVSSEAIESGKAKINTSNFTSGIYMYRVVGKYNQVLTTGKFTVSK
jgi:hypothetical protein